LIPFYQIIREIIMFKQKYYFFLVGESCLILFATKFILLVRLLLWGSSLFQQGFCNGQVEPKPQQEQIDYWAEIDWNLFCFATFSQFSYSICRNRKRWWNQISRRYPDQIIQETNRATKVQRDWEIQFTIDTQFWKPPDLETTNYGDIHSSDTKISVCFRSLDFQDLCLGLGNFRNPVFLKLFPDFGIFPNFALTGSRSIRISILTEIPYEMSLWGFPLTDLQKSNSIVGCPSDFDILLKIEEVIALGSTLILVSALSKFHSSKKNKLR